jgi:N-methylhydantoinase B
MFDAFKRTAMSTIITEVLDMATGITDKYGDLASSGMGIPGFIGCLGKAVQAILKKF